MLAIAACSSNEAARDPAPPTSTSAVAQTTTSRAGDRAAAEPAAEAETVVLDVDGVVRSYRLYVPPSLGSGSAALVVDLHGFGSDPENQDLASGMRRLAGVEGFVVAQPIAQGAVPTWNGQPGDPGAVADVAFLRALVNDVAGRVDLDTGAVFASGFSNGGSMAHRLACDASEVFAAIGTVAGQFPLVERCDPGQPVAVIAFHGTADIVVPFGGISRFLPDVPAWAGRWSERNDCAPVPARERIAADVIVDRWVACAGDVEVAFYTVEGGSHSWPGSTRPGGFRPTQSIDATPLMWDFFASHRRG